MPATNNVIEVIVSLVDKATAPLAGLTRSVGQFKGLAAAALGGWTLNKFIANITEAEDVALKLDIAFRNVGKTAGITRDQLDDLATELQRTTTLGDEQVKSAEALLLTFTRVRGQMFERAIRTAADLSAFMGTDIAQATRMIGFAMQDPAIGMMMLRRARISLTAAEREAIKTLTEQGNLYGAQAKLLEVVESKTRGLAAAQRDTLSGSFRALQNHIGDLLEGDRGSFKGAVDAINGFSKALQDPALKQGIDTLIAFLVDSIGLLAKAAAGWTFLAASIGTAIKAAAEGVARLAVGSDDVITRMGEHIRENQEAQFKLRQLIAGNQLILGSGQTRGRNVAARRLVEQQKELEALIARGNELQKQRAYELEQRHKLVTAAENQTKAAKDAAESAAALGFDPDAVAERFLAAQKAMRSEIEKTADELRGQSQLVAQLYQLPDTKLADLGIARADLDAQMATIRQRMESAIGKGVEVPVSVALNAGELEAAREELRQLLLGFERETRTARERSIAEWTSYVDKLAELLAAGPEKGGITYAQFAERLTEYSRVALDAAAALPGAYAPMIDVLRKLRDEGRLTAEQFEQLDLLSEVKITVPRIELPKPEDLMAPFRERMAQTLQTTFADAFMNIGKGWEGTVRAFLDGFKRILAEAAAMRLARFFELGKVIAGAPTKSVLGKVIGAIMPPLPPKSSSAVAGEAERDDRAVGAAVGAASAAVRAPGSECAAQCAGEVVKTATTTIAGVVQENNKTIAEYVKNAGQALWDAMKNIGGGLWKFITKTLGGLWKFIADAVSAIRAMTSSGGGSGGGGWLSAIVGAVGAFFGGSAGGGRVKGGQPRKVGEEGPEWIVPAGDSEVMNERQVRFAGAGLLAALGALTAGIEAVAADLGRLEVARTEAPTVNVAAPRVTVPAVAAPDVRVAAPQVVVPRPEPSRPLPGAQPSANAITLNFSPTYHFATTGDTQDGKVDPRLLAYIERRDQKSKAEIMDMLRRNGFGRMSR